MADIKPKDATGCLVGIMSLFISCPLWLVLMFGVLSRVDAPGWMWAIYWIYVPTQICIVALASVLKLME